jgi:hypothetical protein
MRWFLGFLHLIHSLKNQSLMLTPEEFQCYKIAQSYRRKAVLLSLLSIHRIFWPSFVSRIAWSQGWRLLVQGLIFLLLWPGIILWGIAEYLLLLLKSPWLLLGTFRVPKGVRSPGEKSLVGIHNAFQDVLDMPNSMYIHCIDSWLVVLFGALQPGATLREYVKIEQDRKQEVVESQFELAGQLRCEIAVARENLSRDLGHYLIDKAQSTS